MVVRIHMSVVTCTPMATAPGKPPPDDDDGGEQHTSPDSGQLRWSFRELQTPFDTRHVPSARLAALLMISLKVGGGFSPSGDKASSWTRGTAAGAALGYASIGRCERAALAMVETMKVVCGSWLPLLSVHTPQTWVGQPQIGPTPPRQFVG